MVVHPVARGCIRLTARDSRDHFELAVEEHVMAYIDPTEVSPANYKTVWEEGDRRVVEMTLPAGTSDIQHSHPNEVV